jgi:hypothetical protein
LSSNSSQTLIGISLGDGYLQKRSSTANSRFMFAQTSVDHKAYYEFIFKLFEPYSTADTKSYLKIWRQKKWESLSIIIFCYYGFTLF